MKFAIVVIAAFALSACATMQRKPEQPKQIVYLTASLHSVSWTAVPPEKEKK